MLIGSHQREIAFVQVVSFRQIDIEHREQARSLGIVDYRMVPGLNDSPAFIGALAGLVRACVGAPPLFRQVPKCGQNRRAG